MKENMYDEDTIDLLELARVLLKKWWLILLLVHINDKYNYHSFYESNAFNKIWKMLSNNNILED